ncbi:MAG: hypothetical protein K8I82_15765, partial [Anaerolineae bacterium]|nr:hypothetical protein [Anaerolineae bacterium]
ALEMYERWQAVNPNLRLLGVEIDPERVAAAQPYAQPPTIEFRLGGFNLYDEQQAQVIRVYNVLRQYEESAVPDALWLMAQRLAPGGILLEGTSTPTGRLVAFDVYQKTDTCLQHRELVFGTNFRSPIEVADFQAILPKRLIHRMREEKLSRFFESWQRALILARGRGMVSPCRQWVEAGKNLRTQFPVDFRPRILRRGFLVIRDRLSC